jgi:plasmid stabilization system protein ParE
MRGLMERERRLERRLERLDGAIALGLADAEAGRGGDNPTRPDSFVEELLDRCLALADTPRAFPLVPRYERFGIRRCVHGNYLIFYRLQPEQIEVIHVLQGARDIEVLLFGSP